MENWLDMYDKGGLIKRADGSYSRRGLWDNIRANRGSGRKPTAEMLEQERKINKYADGDIVGGEDPPATFGNPFANYMRDWTNSPMGQSMLQKSVQKDNPSGNRFIFWNDTAAENTMRNIRGERLNPNYSKTSFTKPYWEQMKDARISAINNVDFQSLSNQDFNSYLNSTGDYNLAPNEISSVAGQSSFNLTRKPFGDFIDNPSTDKSREITRPENVDNTNYLNFVGNPYRALTEYTPSSKNRPMIRLRNNVPDNNFADTSVHEISHTSDWNGKLMPMSDKNLIESYGKNAADTKFNNYVKDATETRARLNSLRYQMKNQGIYDPFTEKATIDMFDSYKPLDNSSYDALEQLRGVYSDDEILNMINTISRKEPAKNPMLDNIQYAKDGGWIDMYNEGSWVADSSIPTPTTPSFYDAGEDTTLTNYQIGTPKARMYGPGGGVNTLEGDMIANVLMNRNRNKDFVQRAYAVGENPNSPMFNLFDPEKFGFKMSHKMGWGEDDSGQAYMFPTVMNPTDEAIKVPNQYADYISSEGYKNATGIPMNAMGGSVMYNAGSTVWTNQDSALWVNGGKEIGTQDKRYPSRNTGSLNTSRYRIGDVIPTGMDYKTPSAGTYDYNKDVQPPKQMVLHAPDTLRIGDVQSAKYGGHIKKHINSPRVYGNPITPSGMYADGSTIGSGETLPIDPRTGLPVKTLKGIEVIADKPLTLEQKIDKRLGYPMKKAFNAAEAFSIDRYNKKLDQIDTDNYRHPMGAKYTSEAIQREFPSFLKGTGIPEISGFLGANALGLGHEIKAFNTDRPLWESLRSTGEDLYNNAFGSIIGSLSFLPETQKTKILQNATINGYIPDGEHYGKFDINNYKSTNNLQQKKRRDGGWIDKYDDGSTIGGEDNIVGVRGPNDNIKVEADPATGMPISNLKGVEVNQVESPPSGFMSYKSNPAYFDNHSVLHDNPQYNENVKKMVYSGKAEYNPTTGEMRFINGQGADAATQQMNTEDYTRGVMRDPFDPRWVGHEQRLKSYLIDKERQAYQSPLMYAPGMIGMSMLPTTWAMGHGLGLSLAQLGQGDYKNAAIGAGLSLLPFAGPAISGGKNVLNQTSKFLTTQTPLKNTYNVFPEGTFTGYSKLRNPNNSYRVAGLDAVADFENTGVLRSNPTIVPANFSEGVMGTRTTGFPSFQKGYADLGYLPEEGGVVFETSLPTFKRGEINPITGNKIGGRHYAHRVIDSNTGAVATEIPATDIKVFEGTPNWFKGFKETTPSRVRTVSKVGTDKFFDATGIKYNPGSVDYTDAFILNNPSKDAVYNTIKDNAEYIKSDLYKSRRMAATGETSAQVDKATDQYLREFENGRINLDFTKQPTTETGFTKAGSYSSNAFVSSKFPFIRRGSNITLYPSSIKNADNFLGSFGHELSHAFSPVQKRFFGYGSDKGFTKFPALQLRDYKSPELTKDEAYDIKTYFNTPEEQGVRGYKLNRDIRQDLGLTFENTPVLGKRHIQTWFDNPTNQAKLRTGPLSDVGDLFNEARLYQTQQFGDKYSRPMFRLNIQDWLNKTHEDGGYIQNNNSNTWLEQYN
jgi:hypothetical protein